MENTLLGLLLVVIFVAIPGAALAVRWVLRPLLQELTSAVTALRSGSHGDVDRRVLLLEQTVHDLETELASLRDTKGFYEALNSGSPEAPLIEKGDRQ